MPRRSSKVTTSKRSRKIIGETTAELVGEIDDNCSPRSDAVFAPIAFEDEDDLPRQTLPMHVVRKWLG